MTPPRAPQFAYSDLQKETFNETKRRAKGSKILAVVQHFLGRVDLSGMVVVDVGCSTGFTADEFRKAGASTVGIDIDVPGLAYASRRFRSEIGFTCADGASLPFPDDTIDVVIFNHIYEHTVDADAVLAEIARILRFDGIVYLGLGNKRVVIEPHYRLPFLSWMPRNVAHKYVRLSGRAPNYYEQFRTSADLRRMCSEFNLWDYTYTILCDPEKFKATDMVPKSLADAPRLFWSAFKFVMPTFVWIGTLGAATPAEGPTRCPPDALPKHILTHPWTRRLIQRISPAR